MNGPPGPPSKMQPVSEAATVIARKSRARREGPRFIIDPV